MVDEAKAALSSDSSAESGKTESELDFTGQNIVRLLGQGTELAEGNSLYAVEITQGMPDQLWTAQKMVTKLQARAPS